ncbi:hypothetical protein LTR62_005938 [Meristemomyces frigidus]|uniref:SET domain-containing protein n=1 Tax=Meristemomyces frigidus TaxID=1508187 RepID=A0AAN7YTF7_9PEZI|nr:hypothetical protein LTR62_005938 [Meristemomyces frigidus]
MALPTATESETFNLNHIYFASIPGSQHEQTSAISDRGDGHTIGTISRSVSPSVGNSDDLSTSSSSSNSTHSFNPQASSFKPMSWSLFPPPTAARQFELRKVEGKGLGLFATSYIPAGTRVICEAPLLQIPDNALHLAWGPYCRLSNDQKKAFDVLHHFKPEHLNTEQVSRTFLVDVNDSSLDEEDVEELIQDQARVMGTFACNNFQAAKGLAVFETTSRLNHSCVPNVQHSWNPSIKQLTVYATRDIHADEELCTTYLGGPGVYYVRSQRIELLRSSYGFTCTCPACADNTGISEGRRQLMANIAYGLQVYQYGGQGQESVPYVPATPVMALKQAEDLICMLLDEGIFSLELCKAYRMASTVALAAKNWEKARDYALDEADIERNCLGPEVADLIKVGAAALCWIEQVRMCLVKAKVYQPEQKLKRRKNPAHTSKPLKPMATPNMPSPRKKAKASAKKQAQKAQLSAEREAKAAEKRAKFEAEEEERREVAKRAEFEKNYPALRA